MELEHHVNYIYIQISLIWFQNPNLNLIKPCIYYVAALSVAGVYATITTLTSFLVILAPASSAILVLFAIFDVVSFLSHTPFV